MRQVGKVAALAAFTACDGSTHTAGRVRDEAGAPVPGAVVVLERAGRREVVSTDSAGAYAVSHLHGAGHAAVAFRFCKDGFQTEARAFPRDDSIPHPLDVTLRRSPPAADAAGHALGPCA